MKTTNLLITFSAILLLCMCDPNMQDPNSVSNFDILQIKSYNLEMTVDFENEKIIGSIRYDVFPLDDFENIILDSWDIHVTKLMLGSTNSHVDPFEYAGYKDNIGQESFEGGSIEINAKNCWPGENPDDPKTNIPTKNFQIYLEYETLPRTKGTRSGFTFLQKNLIRKAPFFYTENIPVYFRTWVPFQDTPQVSSIWTAKISVPKDLKVYMSGNSDASPIADPKNADNMIFSYSSMESSADHDHQLPGYQVAIVIGDLTEQPVSDRVTVIAEDDQIEKAQQLFKNVGTYIADMESYLDLPYQWDSLNLVVMPSNFPFEGLTYPPLALISPTLFQTDDLTAHTALIHQVAQTYFGSVVFGATWRDVWISEGFATYIKRKVDFNTYGLEYQLFDQQNANFTMIQDMKSLPEGFFDTFASLHPDTANNNPDLAISSIPAEKGYQFLLYLEKVIDPLSDNSNFKNYLRSWIREKQFTFADSEDFKASYLKYAEALPGDYIDTDNSGKGTKIDWDSWIVEPGLIPKDKITPFQSTDYFVVQGLADKILQFAGTSVPNNYLDLYQWNDRQVMAFLDIFIANKYQLNKRILKWMEKEYEFASNQNIEIKYRWFVMTILAKYDSDMNAQLFQEFMLTTGRIAFVQPIFEALMATGQESAAKEIINLLQSWYHPFLLDRLRDIVYGEDYWEQDPDQLQQQQQIMTEL